MNKKNNKEKKIEASDNECILKRELWHKYYSRYSSKGI